jgi:hypothetical protein
MPSEIDGLGQRVGAHRPRPDLPRPALSKLVDELEAELY